MQTVAEVEAWLSRYTFSDWTLYCREPHLARNRGCGQVLRMAHRDLADSEAPERRTTFDMEIPVQLPVAEEEAERLLWTLIQFTALHEAAEWFQRDGVRVFDPHSPAQEPLIYATPTVVWSEADG